MPRKQTVRAYGDRRDDGMMQVAFTLPVPSGDAGDLTALRLVAQMGLDRAEIAHRESLLDGYTRFVIYGSCRYAVEFDPDSPDVRPRITMCADEVDSYVERVIGRKIVVVGASCGSDAHSVGIDAILGLKGFRGDKGLEGFRTFEVHNLGSQVPNECLLTEAIARSADAVLVSQTVTHHGLHRHNLADLIGLARASSRRDDLIMICGGPHVLRAEGEELGFDGSFSVGTTPQEVATFIAQELALRLGVEKAASYAADLAPA